MIPRHNQNSLGLFGARINTEIEVCKFLRSKPENVIFLNRAVDGLLLVFTAILQKGDGVLVSPYTCISVISAIIDAGLIPHFMTLSDGKILCVPPNAEISQDIKLIIATHTFGLICDLEYYVNFAKYHNLILIEDCAQAFQSSALPSKKYQPGTTGDFAIYSFGAGKTVDLGRGGAIVVNDIARMDEIRKGVTCINSGSRKAALLMLHLWKIYRSAVLILKTRFCYHLKRRPHSLPMYSSGNAGRVIFCYEQRICENKFVIDWLRRTDIATSIENSKKILKIYLDKICENEYVTIPEREKINCDTVMPFCPLLVKDRYELYKELFINGVDCGFSFSYHCDSRHDTMDNWYNYLSSLIINLPIHDAVTVADASKIATIINNWSKSRVPRLGY